MTSPSSLSQRISPKITVEKTEAAENVHIDSGEQDTREDESAGGDERVADGYREQHHQEAAEEHVEEAEEVSLRGAPCPGNP